MISQELEVSLHMAFVEARSARHEFITVEHLLLSLLDNASAVEVLRACAANLDDLPQPAPVRLGKHARDSQRAEVDTQPTLGFQRVIQRAIMHVSAGGTGKKPVTGANARRHFRRKDSHAVYYLQQQGVTRLDVVNFRRMALPNSHRWSPPPCRKSSRATGRPGRIASVAAGSVCQ